MGNDKLRRFEDIAFSFSGCLVLLDVDGTLVPDGVTAVADDVRRKVQELKAAGNEIWICSNSRRRNYAERLAAIGAQIDVPVCKGFIRKPSTSVLAHLDVRGRELAVIGDKDLTDGLLARRAGAHFIKVRRKTDRTDRPISRVTELLDDMFGPVILFLWDRICAPWRRSSPR